MDMEDSMQDQTGNFSRDKIIRKYQTEMLRNQRHINIPLMSSSVGSNIKISKLKKQVIRNYSI